MTGQPIAFYYWTTPNAWKVAIFLEETGLPYTLVPVDITRGAQFADSYAAISPACKVPAIADPQGTDGAPVTLFESGAILLYLAEKTGRFGPQSARDRAEMLPWLMFQMAAVGPLLGQNHHFRQYAPEKIPYAIDRYTNEARRLYTVMDRHLKDREYFCGEYSVVDMAVYPWIVFYKVQGQEKADFPALFAWYDRIKARPAVRKALDLGKEWHRKAEDLDEEARRALFGTQRP